MGWGDEIIGSGLARRCVEETGKRMAFGDGKRILWSQHAHEIFKGNPNVVSPGSEIDKDVVWCAHYGGHRLYGSFVSNKWHWKKFECVPGQLFLTEDERMVKNEVGIVIEPRTKNKPNKQWPVERYQTLADLLVLQGYTVSQLVPPSQKPLLYGIQRITTNSFRRALGVLSHAQLYIGCEGGLHHGAAALNVPAVVLFGGFIGPETTGYASHINLTGGATACGSPRPCAHCRAAMDRISVDEVLFSSLEQLRGRNGLEVQGSAERERASRIREPFEEGENTIIPGDRV